MSLGPNSRFDFDDELMQAYSSIDNYKIDISPSSLDIYDHDNPDIANMEKEAAELIQKSGATTLIYLRANDMGAIDDTYDEISQAVFEKPLTIKGLFTPSNASIVKVKYGIDINLKFTISYSRALLLQDIGPRLIRTGDVVQVPHNTLIQTQATEFLDGKVNRLDKFRVISGSDTGNFNYRWLYWTINIEPVTGDITVRPDA